MEAREGFESIPQGGRGLADVETGLAADNGQDVLVTIVEEDGALPASAQNVGSDATQVCGWTTFMVRSRFNDSSRPQPESIFEVNHQQGHIVFWRFRRLSAPPFGKLR